MVTVILDIVLELFYWQKNTSICIEHALKTRLNIGQPKTFITWHGGVIFTVNQEDCF